MGKRKRSEDEVNGFDQLESRRRRVDKLLQHGTAKISQHLEAAKKTDTSDAAAIKAIDTRNCATEKVQKSLKKILTHPALPDSIKTFVKEPKDGITRDVISKLWNNKGPQKALNKLLLELENALDLSGTLIQQDKKTKSLVSELDKDHTAASEEVTDNVKGNAVKEGLDMDSGIELASDAAGERKSYDIPLESASGTDNDKTKRRLKPDLAAFERIVRHGIREPKLKQNKLPAPYRPAEQPSSTPEPVQMKTITATGGKDSVFLPSLSAPDDASIYGNESSDGDADLLATSPQRKNRLGQQARRLRNERKFGNNAHHLQKDSRDVGWDKKRGAVEEVPHVKKKRSQDNLRDDTATQDHGNKRQKRDDEGILHPSWMAAKKMKAAESSVLAWSGKKMTFDD